MNAITSPCPSEDCDGTLSWFPVPYFVTECPKCGAFHHQDVVLHAWNKEYKEKADAIEATLIFEGQDLFYYRATITRIIDGDTFEANVDLGFNVSVQETFRLEDFDTPEPTWRSANAAELAHGILASQMAEDLLLNKSYVIRTKKSGKYGRWIANVILGGSKKNPVLLTDFLSDHNMHKFDDYSAFSEFSLD